MPKKTKPNYEAIQQQLFQRIHRTGEEMKNDFPNKLESAIRTKAWQHFRKADGSKFDNLGEWLLYSFPHGLSMGLGRTAISYDDALQLCKDRPELYGLLLKHRPDKRKKAFRDTSAAASANGATGSDKFDNIKNIKSRTGTSRAYLESRLQKDHPQIYADYQAGHYRSARQAAIKAGIIEDTHDALKRLKSTYRRATKKQQAEFARWLRTAEGKAAKK